MALAGQSAVHGSAVHAEAARDVLDRAPSGGQEELDEPPHPVVPSRPLPGVDPWFAIVLASSFAALTHRWYSSNAVWHPLSAKHATMSLQHWLARHSLHLSVPASTWHRAGFIPPDPVLPPAPVAPPPECVPPEAMLPPVPERFPPSRPGLLLLSPLLEQAESEIATDSKTTEIDEACMPIVP